MEDPPQQLKEKEKVDPSPEALPNRQNENQTVNRIKIHDVDTAIKEVTKLLALLDKMPTRDVNLYRILQKIDQLAHEWKRAPTNKKEECRKQFYKKVASWNRKVCRVRQAQNASPEEKNLPSINTKARHSHSQVAETIKLVSGESGDSGDQKNIISICSHGNHNKKPCWLVTSEELSEKVKSMIDDETQWVYVPSKKINESDFIKNMHTHDTSKLQKRIGLKCPGEKKDCCDNPDSNKGLAKDRSTCGSIIKLSKIIQYMPRDDRNIFTTDQLLKMIMKTFLKQRKIVYCPKETCKWSKIGLFGNKNSGYWGNHCKWCDKREDNFYHKIVCHCGINFCDLCMKQPYHQHNEICPGPPQVPK